MQYLFRNIKGHTVKLPGRDGKLVHFAVGEQKALDSYFKKYAPKYLAVVREVKGKAVNVSNQRVRVVKPKTKKTSEPKKVLITRKAANSTITVDNGRRVIKTSKVVGRASKIGRKNATAFSQARITENSVPISNDIGVGILSFNRLKSLIPLIESIRKYTDLKKTTIFVSDESTNPEVWNWLKEQKDIVVFHEERKGIAVNTNRILRCLARFKYKLLLNDDVEVLKEGWDSFYFETMKKTGLKHFCYRQRGIYGAERPRADSKGLLKIVEKPHGAVLAVHDDAFREVGYFDEGFGTYGFEHVEYSDRIARVCHKEDGYFDVSGSDSYFRIYDDTSSDPEKHRNYAKAKKRYAETPKNRKFVDTTDNSAVPGITYIIPFRDIGRQECVRTVVNNIKAQRYPEIQIILAEQDERLKTSFSCIDHILVKSWFKGMHFCKAAAFNRGVEVAKFDKLILHDADMLVRSDYTHNLSILLTKYESAHIGATVCYMEKESTDKIVRNQSINRDQVSSDRIVNYYEGGSFGILKSAYIRIGGFCEDFIGYGCFTENNYVVTSDGLVDIKDVQVDDYVLTHTGEYHAVTRKFIRNHGGEVHDIFIPGRLPIKGVTEEHPFLVDGEWIRVDDLKIGMKSTFQPDYLDLVQYQDLSYISNADNSKNEINIDFYSKEFSWFVGVFLAEGVVKLNKAVYLYIAEDESCLLSRILDMINKINPMISVKSHYVKNGCREVRIFSSKLAKIINAVSPKSIARNKVLAKWYIEKLNTNSKLWLLNGLIDGDGDKQHGSKKRLVYTTGSINLANIISMMMGESGITHSFGIRKTGGFTENDYYSLTINRNCERFLDVVGMIKEDVVSHDSNFGHINEIRKRLVNEPVYNLEVECDNSYIVNGVVVHNCEDTEFYKRMTEGTKSFTQRSVDLFHLWHGRTDGWTERHDINKNIQVKMFKENQVSLYKRLNKFLLNKYEGLK